MSTAQNEGNAETGPAASGGESRLAYDVLILGGGFAGVYAAQTITKHLRGRSAASVALIASENHMVFQPMLPEVAGSELSPRHVVNPIRLLCRGVDVLKGEVEEVDCESRQVLLNAGAFTRSHRVGFRQLVIALGAVVDLRRIPGMAEHSLLMQNVGDAMKLRETVIARMEEANLEPDARHRRRLLEFAVVGGGYSGVETAGQIMDLLDSIHPFYRNVDKGDFGVALIHSRDHLLPTMTRRLGEYTAGKLAERGIEVILGCRVNSVTAARLRLDNGQTLTASTVISTVGNAPHPVVVDLCSRFGLPAERGRIRVDRRGRVEGSDFLWAAGDCASMPMPGSDGETCPPTAQFAMRQGTLLGGNVAASILGHREREFAFRGLGELAVIGHRTAVANIMGLQFSGFLAWWMWRTIYLMKLPGLERKLRVMLDWTLDIFFPRDITLLTPRYTSPLKEMHLSGGDTLFHAGEPAFSFYLVKEGTVEIRDANGAVIKAIGRGGHFGERALLSDRRWRFSAVAAEPTILMSMGYKAFKEIVGAGGSFNRMLQQSAEMYQSSEEIDLLLEKVPESVRRRTAGDLMNDRVVTVRDGISSAEAIRLFREERHSAYPVVDGDGRVRGLLRRADFYEWYKNAEAGERLPLDGDQLSAVTQVAMDTPAGEVFEQMVRAGSTKVVVADADGRLAGIIALVDLLRD